MKRKLTLLALALLVAVASHAQFEQGKVYVGGTLSGLGMSYNGSKDFSFGLNAEAGYMTSECFMIIGRAGYAHQGGDAKQNNLKLGGGVRYYIIQNGLFIGANANYVHAEHGYNDFMPGIEVGYAFFISKTVTIEPSIYYDQSIKKHSDYSTVGLKIGVGVYI